MKRGILILLLLVFAHAAHAEIFDETVFDEKLTSSGSYSASNGENFTIGLISDRISVEYDGGAFIVRNASCDSDDKYEVCLSVTEFSHYNYNYTGEKIVNFRHVTIGTFLAELSINRTFEKTEFWTGQNTLVTTRIQNIGQRSALVAFSDNFSSAFEVALPLECNLKGNAVVWKGTLSPKELAVCIYRITALSPGDYTSVAEASFNTGLSDITASNSAELSVREFALHALVNLSSSSMELGSTFFANFSLSSSQDIYPGHYRVAPGEGISVVSSSGFTTSGNVLEYNGKVSSPVQLSAVFSAERTGNLTLSSNALFFIPTNTSRIKQEFTRYEGVSAYLKNATARLPVTEVENGNSISIIIANPSNRDIYNVAVNLVSNATLSRATAFFNRIGFSEFRDFTTSIDSPYTNNTLSIQLAYESQYGEKFAAESVHNVTIINPSASVLDADANTAAEQLQAEAAYENTNYPSIKVNLSPTAVIAATAIILVLAAVILFFARKKRKPTTMSDFDSIYRSDLFERK